LGAAMERIYFLYFHIFIKIIAASIIILNPTGISMASSKECSLFISQYADDRKLIQKFSEDLKANTSEKIINVNFIKNFVLPKLPKEIEPECISEFLKSIPKENFYRNGPIFSIYYYEEFFQYGFGIQPEGNIELPYVMLKK
jgi:hypothetical protein